MSDFDIRGSLKLANGDFTRGIVEAKAEVKSLKREAEKPSRLGLSTSSYSKGISQSRKELAALQRDAEKFHREEINRERQRRSFFAGLTPGGRRATGLAGLAGAVTGGTVAGAPIAGSALSLLSTMPALTAGLAPLAGLLPTLGTAAVGAGEGMLVLKDATDGFNKVINADTPKKLSTALKGLDKDSQAAAYTFRKELHPALDRLHELSQKVVLPSLFKLGYAFEQLTKPGQAFFDGFKAAGKGLSEVVNSLTNLFEDKGFKKRLDDLLKTAGEGIGKLGHILPPLLDMFVRMSNLAAPLLGKMADSMAHFFQTADHWVSGHGKQISKFFDTTFSNLGVWLHGIGDVGKIFFGLSTAASGLSHSLGQGITDFLDKLAAFVNSKDGQTKLKAFFAEALPTLRSFGGLVKDLFSDLGRLGADPRTQKFIQGLFDFLRASLLPLLATVAEAMPNIAAGLLPVMHTLGEFMDTSMQPLVAALVKLVEVALPPLIPLVKSIADILARPLSELTKIVDLLTRALDALGSVGGTTGGVLDIAALFGIAGLAKAKGGDMLSYFSGGFLGNGPRKGDVTGYVGKQKMYGVSGGAGAESGALAEGVLLAGMGSKEAVDGVKKTIEAVGKLSKAETDYARRRAQIIVPPVVNEGIGTMRPMAGPAASERVARIVALPPGSPQRQLGQYGGWEWVPADGKQLPGSGGLRNMGGRPFVRAPRYPEGSPSFREQVALSTAVRPTGRAAEYDRLINGGGLLDDPNYVLPKSRLGGMVSTGVEKALPVLGKIGKLGKGLATFELMLAGLAGADDLASGKGFGHALKTTTRGLLEPFGSSSLGAAAAGAGYGATVGGLPGAGIGAIVAVALHDILGLGKARDKNEGYGNDDQVRSLLGLNKARVGTAASLAAGLDVAGLTRFAGRNFGATAIAAGTSYNGAPARGAAYVVPNSGAYKGMSLAQIAKAPSPLSGMDPSKITALDRSMAASDTATQKLAQHLIQTFGPEMVGRMQKFSGAVNTSIVGSFQAALSTGGSVLDALRSNLKGKLDAIKTDFGSLQKGQGLQQAKLAIEGFASATGTAIGQSRESVHKGVQSLIASLKLVPHGTKFVRQAFGTMVAGIQEQMRQGVISTVKGAKAIAQSGAAILKAMGVKGGINAANINKDFAAAVKLTGSAAGAYGVLNAAGVGAPEQLPAHGGAGQRGLMVVGRESAVGGDTVRASFNGRPAVVAEGENIAVFNRHQRKELNERLADVGGLRGFFESRRKRHTDPMAFAGGGFTAAPGTDYSYGQEPEIARRLNRLGHALGINLVGISGHRTPQHSIDVGGFADDPHTRGEASDTPAAAGIPERILEKYGLTRPFGGAREADHIQLFGKGIAGLLGGHMALGGGGAKIPPLKLVKEIGVGLGGLPGAVAQATVDNIRHTVNSLIKKKHSGLGGLSGGTSGANQKLGHQMMLAMGWDESQWPALRALWTRESGWNQNARNPSSGAYGIPQALGHGHVFGANPADQIRWGLRYIKGRYGSPSAAWAHELSAGWYSTGGMTSRDANTNGDTSDPPSPPNPTYDPQPPPKKVVDGPKTTKKKKKSSHAKGKRPVSGGPAIPTAKALRGVKPKKRHGAKIPGLSKRLKKLSKLIDKDVEGAKLQRMLDAITGARDNTASRYSPTLSLYDGDPVDGGLPDLTNYLNAHPEELRGLPNAAAWIDAYDNGLEVPNTTDPKNLSDLLATGLSDQGVFTPGIPEHLAFDMKEFAGYKNYLAAATAALNGTGGGKNGKKGYESGYLADLDYLNTSWHHYDKIKRYDEIDLKDYTSHHLTWDQKISKDEGKIALWQKFLDSYRQDATSHRMSSLAQRHRNDAEKAIKGLRTHIASLKKNKQKNPNEVGNRPVKHKSESTAAYNKRVRQWSSQIHEDNTHAGKLRAHIIGYENNQQFIDGDTRSWNTNGGLAFKYASQVAAVKGNVKDIMTSLLPDLYDDIYATTHTRIPPIALGSGGSSAAADAKAISDEQAANALRNLALASEQFKVFAGFAPLVGARMVGAFAHGGVVPETGMALVHRNETIIPDPEGPYSNRVAAAMRGGSGDTHLELHLHGGLDAVVERGILKHGPKLIKLTSERQGRRTRLIASAPGGR